MLGVFFGSRTLNVNLWAILPIKKNSKIMATIQIKGSSLNASKNTKLLNPLVWMKCYNRS